MKRLLTLFALLPLLAFGQGQVPSGTSLARIGYNGQLIGSVIGAMAVGGGTENPTGPASIAGMAVDESGWVLEVYIKNLSTGGTYAYGFDTNNNVVEGTKVAMNVTSQGFATNTTATTRTRTLYGTYRLRKPYPNQAQADEAIVGDTVKIKLALSDYVYLGDSNLTATVLSGLYTQGGTNSLAATSMTVTNRSGQSYFQPVANWSRRGYRVIDTENLDLRVVAFHREAMNGLPIAAVEFVARDSGGTSFTNIQTTPVLTTDLGDATPVIEYVANFGTNTLASGLVTCNARVFPWIGDSTAIKDSRSYTGNTPHFAELTNAVNYARIRAIVATSGGSDTTGVAATDTYWATNSSPAKFATIGRALLACANTNNTHLSRGAQFGGAIIYLEDGNHTYMGSTVTLTTAQPVEAVITPASGATKAGARITAAGTDQRAMDNQDKIRLKGITVDTASTTLFSQCAQVAFEDCNVHSTGSPVIQQTSSGGIITMEWCNVTNFAQGLQSYNNQNSAFALTRGNTIWSNVPSMQAICAIGNLKTTNATQAMNIKDLIVASQLCPTNTGHILAFNRFYNLDGLNQLQFGNPVAGASIWGGQAIVQNVFESSGTNTLNNYGATLTRNDANYTNVIAWNNVFLGVRYLTAYNASGTNAAWRVGLSWLNNIYDTKALKTDDYTADPQGTRIGNWAFYFGAGLQGNAFLSTTNMGTAADEFLNAWPGIGSYEPGAFSSMDYPRFVRRGTVLTVGETITPGGDYRLKTDSPLLTKTKTRWVLPYDITGRTRGTNDPPGPYNETVAP